MMSTSPIDLFARATFDFTSSVQDELELQVGCLVKIIKEIDEFWYLGQNLHNGSSGMFPKDFVDCINIPKLRHGESLLFALDTFYAEEKDDLPFKKGYIIILHHKVDEAWGFGSCNNRKGIFPLNYTKPLIVSTISQNISISLEKNKILCTVKATMPLSAQIEGELSFVIGDSIEVTQIMPDEWAFGYIGYQSGTFPLSFTTYDKKNNFQTVSKNSSFINKQQVDINGGGFFESDCNYQQTSNVSGKMPLNNNGFKCLLKEVPSSLATCTEQPFDQAKPLFKSSDNKHSFSRQNVCSLSSESYNGHNSNDLKDITKRTAGNTNKYYVVANYSHYASNAIELSFKEGDVIEVLGKKTDLWFYGKLHGVSGYVPRNFVSDYVISENGHNEIASNMLLSKFTSIQAETPLPRKDYTKKALIDALQQQIDVRLVVQDFHALTDFELSLKVGDTVHFIKQVNTEWSEVKNNKGNSGFVPNNCLQEVKASSANSLTSDKKSISKERKLKEQNISIHKNELEPISKNIDIAYDNKVTESRPSVRASFSASSSESGNAKTQRHSYHSHKGKMHHKSVLKSCSLSVDHPIKALTLTSIADANQSFENCERNILHEDLMSVTSQDSAHSNTMLSSCSSTGSIGKNHAVLCNRSTEKYVYNQSKSSRRISRSAPLPPNSKNDLDDCQYHSTKSEDHVKSSINRIPPVRPPQPETNLDELHNQVRENNYDLANQKLKIEKIRLEIEEYSRMLKNLQFNYNNTFDGKIRQDIAEEKHFMESKLKRLQKELHNLIADANENSNSTEEMTDILLSPPSTTSSNINQPTTEDLVDIKEKRRVKRNHVVQELVKTEEDYLQDVVITINDIMNPLLERELPSDIKLETIFGNIEDIRDCSRQLLISLKNGEVSRTEDSVPLDVNVGKKFIENADRMREVYKLYCRNHDDSTALLEKYEDDPEFQIPVQEYLNYVKNKVNAFDLGSFLIKPVQRILKYPLLLQELLKLTDVPQQGDSREEYDELIQASKLMQDVANDINEDKRRKDLVRKYRKGAQEENFAGKLSRISLHSVRKKSARISLRLTHVTGINQPETVDEKFNNLDQRFKCLEKGIKNFLFNIDTYGNKFRDLLNAERILTEHIEDTWASDRSKLIDTYIKSMRRISDHLYRQFHNQTKLRVHTPLSLLLLKFKGPQSLIEKRSDKLLDYENCQKSTDSKDKLQMARNVYEALNQQLIDELPAFCELGSKLLDTCIALFVQLQIKFQRNIIEVVSPVLRVCKSNMTPKQLDKRVTMEEFNAERNQVLVDMRHFTIIPVSFTAMTSSSATRSSSTSGNSSFYQPLQTKLPEQTQAQKDNLKSKYKDDDLYIAMNSYLSSDAISLSCSAGDIIAAIKRQDPLGNANKWFCDNGVTRGFLPSHILKSYLSCVNSTNSLTQFPIKSLSSVESSVESFKRFSIARVSSGSSSSLSIKNLKVPPEDRRSRKKLMVSENYPKKAQSSDRIGPELERYRLDYDFVARSTLELSVRKEELVTLIEMQDMDGNTEWWLVANFEGKRGYIPANYVSKVEYL